MSELQDTEFIDCLVQTNINQIDPELYELLTRINWVKGITTTNSCFGHHTHPCRIYCEADSIETVNKFMYDYFYGNSGWKFQLYITDVEIDNGNWGKVQFVLCSDEYYMNEPTIDLLVSNLTKTFKYNQDCPEARAKLLLPIDPTISIENVIRDVIVAESQSK